MFTIKLQQHGDALDMTNPQETIERLGLHAGQELASPCKVLGFELTTREARVARQLAPADKVLPEKADALKALANL